MAYPSVAVKFAFGSDPFATPSWSTVSGSLLAATVRTGRDQQAEAFQPASAQVTLDNSNRAFDPLHSAGAYYGSLLPRVRTKLEATFGGTTYDIYEGFVSRDGFPQSAYQHPAQAESQVTCYDGLQWLGEQDLRDAYSAEVFEDEANLVAYWRLGDQDGTQAIDISGNGHHAALSDDAGSFTAAGLVEGTTDTAVTIPVGDRLQLPKAGCPSGTAWTFEFWLSITHDSPATGILLDSPLVGGIILSMGASQLLVLSVAGDSVTAAHKLTKRNHPYHIVCYRDGADIGIYIDGTVSNTSSSASGNDEGQIRVGGYFAGLTFDEIAVYDDWIGSTRTAAHHTAGRSALDGQTTDERVAAILDQIGWPSGDRDVDTGKSSTVLGPATFAGQDALTALRDIERSEQGAVYCNHRDGGNLRFRQRYAGWLDTNMTVSQATFSDEDTGGVLRYDELVLADQPIYNDVRVVWSGGEERVTDSTSIDTYTRQVKTITTAVTTAAEAKAIGQAVVLRHKDRKTHVTRMKLVPSGDDDLWTEVLERKIGDRVTIRRHPQSTGSAFTEDYLVVGIHHTIAEGIDRWDTVYQLDPVYDDQAVWTWGDDAWNTTKVWAQ